VRAGSTTRGVVLLLSAVSVSVSVGMAAVWQTAVQ
jgi:hypothetical protein